MLFTSLLTDSSERTVNKQTINVLAEMFVLGSCIRVPFRFYFKTLSQIFNNGIPLYLSNYSLRFKQDILIWYTVAPRSAFSKKHCNFYLMKL